ncbi:MAG TPA: FkbM family methyltransferase [Candidatus Acidoferrales bacterium]|nr:FkbM family methyltransferase [Candidatus Acidoferrales bacterium]
MVQRACVSSPVFCPRHCWRKKLSRAMTNLDFESDAARPAENIADILFSSGVGSHRRKLSVGEFGRVNQMKTSEQFLRSLAYKLLSCAPSKWAHWFRNRVVLRSTLGKLSINCVLDVGANRGQFGALLRAVGYSGWIISFEPVRASYEKLKATAERLPPWRVFPYALGAGDERREINVTEDSSFSSFLTPREESQVIFAGNRVDRTETVEIRRLDDVLESCLADIPSPRIYLKLDTQGFDVSVLEGAESVLPRILALQTEVSVHDLYHGMHQFGETVSRFEAAGFEIIDFVTVNRDIDQLCAIDMDCVMTRKPDWTSAANGTRKSCETHTHQSSTAASESQLF